MKKWNSRFLSILLSLCMVMGSFSMPVYANEAEAGMEVAEATVDETVVTDEDVTTEEAVTMVETSEVETSEVETEESVSTVETEAVTGEETQEEIELANLQNGDTIHINFTGNYWNAKIGGETAGSISSMDVEVAVGNGMAAFNIPMEAAEGYLITSLESNLSTGFMSSNTVPVYYFSDSKIAQMYFDSSLYIQNNTIEIKINAVEAAHIILVFEGSTNLSKDCKDSMLLDYFWEDAAGNRDGTIYYDSMNINYGGSSYAVDVPINSKFVIVNIADLIDHSLGNFDFYYSEFGQRTEKITTTYDDPEDFYDGQPMFVANKGNMQIIITNKSATPVEKNTYTVSCSGVEHAYIGTTANPSTSSFSAEVTKGKALDVYVKCEEGYAIKGLSSVSGSASFEKGIEGLNTDNYKFTIPADRIVADTVITVTTMVKKATVSSNGGNFKIRPVADDIWYNSIPGEYVGRETPFTFVVKPNTGNVITKVSYK
ncbi:MAG: hypothetical protein KBS96_01820, partial [Lachnospiraceae bacterium]|nr:hypothetical protein [Candidatus Colinaster scatohippi]